MLSNGKTNYYTTPNGFNSYEEYRSADARACDILNKYMDQNVYPLFVSSDRIDTFNEQVHGVDCTFTDFNGFEYICDEKAALKWANKSLETQALELKYINRAGHLHRGWFLDESQQNNCYNFIYTDLLRDKNWVYDARDFKIEDIKEIECYIVRKERLKQYFSSIGWDDEKLLEKAREIRRTNGRCDMLDIEKDGLRFCFSKQLPEKPINVLVSRNTLLSLSDYIYKRKRKHFIFACKKKK